MFIRNKRVSKIKIDGILNVGTNDSIYTTQAGGRGKNITCPYYEKWRSMLRRCYGKRSLQDSPTYKDCTVDKDWLLFTNFLEWVEGEYSEYFEHEYGELPTTAELHSAADLGELCLDKDILVPGNKVYSKDTCCFVTQEVNKLLLDNLTKRGKYPQGVCWDKANNKFIVHINKYGTQNHLGRYIDLNKAEKVYLKEKELYVMEVANTQPKKIKKALLNQIMVGCLVV